MTRKCIKWVQLLVIGSTDSLELGSTTIGHVTTRVHVHKTAIHVIKGFTVAACQRKMLFWISEVTGRELMSNTLLSKGLGKVYL